MQLLVVGLCLAALELGLRLAGITPVVTDPYQGFSGFRPLFVEEDAASADGTGAVLVTSLVTSPGKRRWFNRQRFAHPKPAGTYRIFTLGGSTTYGRPYDDRLSFSAWLRELLPAADSGRGWEVINTGGISYASYRVAAVLDELLAYEPDLFVIYTGHNEFLEARTYRDVSELPQAFRAVAGLASRTSLYAVVHDLLDVDPAGGATGATDAADDSASRSASATPAVEAEVLTRLDTIVGPEAYTRDTVLAERIFEHFRHNLERMLDRARAAGVDVMLVTPASALKDCAPIKSLPADEQGLDAGELYRRGLDHLAAGRMDDGHASLVAAKDSDVCPLRAPTTIVESVRTVAREQGVPLVDFVALVEQRMRAEHGHAAAGREWFLDHVHPTIAGHQLIATEILRRLAEQGVVTLSSAFDDVIVPATGKRMALRLTPEVRGIAWRNLAKVLSWLGQHAEAESYARLAEQTLGPGDSETHFVRGNHARLRGATEAAIDRYRRATEIDDGYAEAFYNLADTLRLAGRFDEAVAPALRAVELLPARAGAHELLGLALVGADRPAEALAPLERATVLAPDDPSAPNNLGLALVRLTRYGPAAEAFGTAVERDPSYVRGHYNLGLTRLALADHDGAAWAFRRVLLLEPGHERAADRLATLSDGGSDPGR